MWVQHDGQAEVRLALYSLKSFGTSNVYVNCVANSLFLASKHHMNGLLCCDNTAISESWHPLNLHIRMYFTHILYSFVSG